MTRQASRIYDELLVLRARRGDKAAFEELVERWQERLWRYAAAVTGSQSTGWDIVQDTWIAVVGSLGRLDDVGAFRTWLFRIANNKCADWIRRKAAGERLNDAMTIRGPNRDDVADQSDERIESLAQAIDRLDRDRRTLVALRFGQGLEIREIARILDVAEGTVRSRLSRTVAELRRIMGVDEDE